MPKKSCILIPHNFIYRWSHTIYACCGRPIFVGQIEALSCLDGLRRSSERVFMATILPLKHPATAHTP